MHLPDYNGGGIANLMASISQGLGGAATGYPPLEGLDPAPLARARNLVLLVIDGLGYRYLREHAPLSELSCHTIRSMTSVCPSTTASAIPTFLTGVPPQQHGLTGWFTYFSEYGAVITVLPYSARLGQMPLDDRLLSPRQLTGLNPFFDRLPVDSHLVMPDWIARSSFNLAFTGAARLRPYSGLNGMVKGIAAAARSGRDRNYIYAYWPEYDALSHHHGVASEVVEGHLLELDQAFCRLRERLAGSDTLLLVTADHGFIDTAPERIVRLQDHPELEHCLMVPLCGEPRLAYCYVHPHRSGQFERYIQEHLSCEIAVVDSREALEQGWFGIGAPHPRLADRVGHYVLVPKENYCITGNLLGEPPLQHSGVHGGLSAWEMQVPLIYAET